MTTDEQEGQRQAEAMQPTPIKVGDKVRLSAGGSRTMTVKSLEDYGNMALCGWTEDAEGGESAHRELFPVRSLVRVDE